MGLSLIGPCQQFLLMLMSRQEDEKKKERNFGVIHSYFPSPATFFNNMHSRSDYDFYFLPFLASARRRRRSRKFQSNAVPYRSSFRTVCALRVYRLASIYNMGAQYKAGDDHYVSGERQMNPSRSDDVSCRVPFLWPFTSSSTPDEYRWGRAAVFRVGPVGLCVCDFSCRASFNTNSLCISININITCTVLLCVMRVLPFNFFGGRFVSSVLCN